MMRIHRRSKSGFTIIELMICVAIIGLLATIAIPNFLRYQARSRRSEAFANLGELARAQKAYQAETNTYHDSAGAEPGPLQGTTKMAWSAAASNAFDILGFRPEGRVFYSYASFTSTSAGPNTCATCDLCFTAVAYGDVDGNNSVQTVQYVHPSEVGGALVSCTEPVLSHPAPVDPLTAQLIYDSVAPRSNSDF